jgi:hypothetical protein
VSLVAPDRIQRWWRRARVLLALRREQESLKALLSSIDRSPMLVKRRSRALSQNALPQAPAQTNVSWEVSWQIALAPPPLGDSGGSVPRPDACDSLLRLVSTEEYHLRGARRSRATRRYIAVALAQTFPTVWRGARSAPLGGGEGHKQTRPRSFLWGFPPQVPRHRATVGWGGCFLRALAHNKHPPP